MVQPAAGFHGPFHNGSWRVISAHRVYSDSDTLRQAKLSLTFVAFFLLRSDRHDELAFVKTAARTYAMRDVERPALGAFGEAGKFQALPVGPARVASRCTVMLFWICHKSNLPVVFLVHVEFFRLKEKTNFAFR